MNPEDNLENFDFAQFLRGRLKERGFNLKKISDASGIAIKHIESLASGNFHNLPSAPYFHGYIARLGQILDFDAEFWWKKLKSTESVKNSATGDEPSKNRFVKRENAKYAWIAAALLVVLLLVFGLPRLIGAPVIEISNPIGNPAVANTNQIDITGTLKNASELYINGELVNPNPDGSWSKTVLLGSSANSFEIRAKKFLGGETKIVEQIIYEPTPAPATSTPTD